MPNVLVAYFSASGVTKQVAERLAEEIGAEQFEIEPEAPYTDADLDWQNKDSRSSVEMSDMGCRPAIRSKVGNMDSVDVVFVGASDIIRTS